ncbi:RNA binding protein [Mycena sanguinolenta]|uniref:RNA binding protein n=1 Tax=Mycena sanguinolenta TaxID=230812 RepID=A0A8H6XEZ4_9AGAR|nr:RNA binding protein [Mycena sanguinolenta]
MSCRRKTSNDMSGPPAGKIGCCLTRTWFVLRLFPLFHHHPSAYTCTLPHLATCSIFSSILMPPKTASRTWGTRFDTLPSSPPPSPQTRDTALEGDATSTATKDDASNVKKVDKMPHDASVFVGSLPTNIEQSELTRLLSEHLSEHAEVKSIKLVKDSKGGVCAFVQCENAAAAASLIHTLHSNAPKHFLGRVLRYEPALNAEHHANTAQDPTADPGLFFQPVVFDETSIRKLCAQFGPLESFGPFKGSEVTNDEGPNLPANTPRYPPAHDGPRLAEMDAGCWEVKWNHRDDAVSALMTLRRVPHLTVTWAHHPSPFGFEQQSWHHHGRFAPNRNNNATTYPFHVQNPLPTQPGNDSLASAPSVIQSPSSTALGLTLHGDTSGSTNTDDWTRITVPSLPAQRYDSAASFRSPGFRDQPPKDPRMEWTDVDFPPLGDSKGDRKGEQVWPTFRVSENESRDRPPSSLSVVIGDVDGVANHHDANAALYHDEEQELDIPSTPGLGMSPITPKTAGSQFPSTPTSTNGDSFQDKSGYFDEAKDIDPTTLFVGGLEMTWDEERVSAFFGRFGGLESVQVVRPMNGRSAFAFVKFNNTESPARAIFEEHNRVHDGRAIRVQLRDCNPPRSGNWRYNGPRRGRFPHSHYSSQRRYPETAQNPPEERLASNCNDDSDGHSRVTDEIVDDMRDLSVVDHKNDSAHVGGLESPAEVEVACAEEYHQAMPQLREDQTQSCPTSRRATPKLSSVSEAPLQPQYREWYDPPPVTMTPPLPSPNSTAAAPGAPPYPIPNGGYYPPSWTQPFPQPYGMPYYPGFPGYPMQGPHPQAQAYPSPVGSDAGEPGMGPPQRPWPPVGMYGGYIAYPAYPRPPNVEPSSPRGQAPLQPTGFIQNEQGTLIPVYQPEALDQYMASNQAAPGTSPGPQPQNGSAAWQQFPPPAHPFPNTIHPMIGIPPRAFPPQAQPSAKSSGWIPGQYPPPPHAAGPGNVPIQPANLRGGYQEGGQGMIPNGRRPPGGRRDQHPSAPHTNRSNPTRAVPNNRYPRGGMHQLGYSPRESVQQLQPLPRQAQFNPAPADWHQWNAAR